MIRYCNKKLQSHIRNYPIFEYQETISNFHKLRIIAVINPQEVNVAAV